MKRTARITMTLAVLWLAVLPSTVAAQENPSPVEVFEQTWRTLNTDCSSLVSHCRDDS